MATNLTASQQQRLDTALKAWQDSQNKEQSFKSMHLNLKAQFEECKRARDSKKTGPGKNKACHITTSQRLFAEQKRFYDMWKTQTQTTASAKANYESVKKAIDAEVDKQIELQQSDPNIAIAQAEAEADVIAAQADADVKKKKQRNTLIIVGVAAVTIVVVALLWRKFA